MLLWLEGQNVGVIVLLAFAFCYALAALVFVASSVVATRRLAADLKGMTPVMLTPLSVIAGLLIAFLASRVWTNLDPANAHIVQEANALRQTILLAESLPPDVKSTVRSSIKRYLQFVETEDWPAMAESRASLQPVPPGITEAMRTLLSFVPSAPGQQLAQERAVIAIEQALEARRSRILLSEAAIAPSQWLAIIVLTTLIFVSIAMVHIDRRATVGVSLFIFSSAVAACLVLLLLNDRPFAAGGFTLEPTALRQVQFD